MRPLSVALVAVLSLFLIEHASSFSPSAFLGRPRIGERHSVGRPGLRAPLGIRLSESSPSPQDALAKAAAAGGAGGGRSREAAAESQLFGEAQSLRALRSVQSEWGAVVGEMVFPAPEPPMKMMKKGADRSVQVVTSFEGTSAEEGLRAIAEGLAATDLSHWGVLEVRGEDRLRFLNGQCTNKLLEAKPMECKRACFINKVGRALDLCTVVVLPDSVLILTSPGTVQLLFQTLDLLIFPKDQVTIRDVSERAAIFAVAGPGSTEHAASVLDGFETPAAGEVCMFPLGEANTEALVLNGCGLAEKGYTFMVNPVCASELWKKLSSGVPCVGSEVWDAAQILDGVPRAGRELTLDYNPLEAGLWSTVSFDKGCYVGQETMARLKTYDGVKQMLWRMDLDRSSMSAEAMQALEGAKIFSKSADSAGGEEGQSERAIGAVTSVCDGGEGKPVHCLCYVRSKAGGEGDEVSIKVNEETVMGKLIRPRYSTRTEEECADAVVAP